MDAEVLYTPVSLPNAFVTSTAERLATQPDLPLPSSLHEKPHEDRLQYLENLLSRDPGVFLERYGRSLDVQQLGEFTPLRSDYEVDFWLRQLEFKPAAEQASVSKTAKNRRLAQMNRLLATDFFEDESSRRRAPLLHEQYIGQYEEPQPPKQHSRLSDRIIYNAQERSTQQKLEQERDAAAELDGQFSESEESEDRAGSEEEVPQKEGQTQQISADQMAENRREFRELMKASFLAGKDSDVDYARIDNDVSLDEDFAKEAQQDAEDEYFSTI